MANNLPAEKKQPGRAEVVVMGLKPEIAKTLPKHIDPDAFARTIQTALVVQPELLETSSKSLFVSCMKAATDGLTLDGREAALVIRNVKVSKKNEPDKWEKQAVYQPMVQGLMKLARNSGQIESITAQIVYAGDTFSYNPGVDRVPNHNPDWFGNRGLPIGAYAVVKMKEGDPIVEIMSAREILNISTQGQNSFQYDPAKGKNFTEWWRKTVIRRITKYIPRSSDAIGRFIDGAQAIDVDFDYSAETDPAPDTTTTAPKKRGAAASKLKDVGADPKKETKKPEPEQDADDEIQDAEIVDGDGEFSDGGYDESEEQGDRDDI